MFLWLIPIMTEHRPGRAVVRRFALHGRVHPFCMSGITHWFVFFVPNPFFRVFMSNTVNKTQLLQTKAVIMKSALFLDGLE